MFYLTTHSTHFIYGYMASEPRTESLAMPESVPANGRVRNFNVYGQVNTFSYQLFKIVTALKSTIVSSSNID